jgi:hypothetical protein
MTRKCHDTVRKAAGDVFSEKEIDDLLDRMIKRAQRLKQEKPTTDARAALAEAAGQLTKEELMAVLQQRRAELAAKVARDARRAKLDAMPAGMNEAQKLAAFEAGIGCDTSPSPGRWGPGENPGTNLECLEISPSETSEVMQEPVSAQQCASASKRDPTARTNQLAPRPRRKEAHRSALFAHQPYFSSTPTKLLSWPPAWRMTSAIAK